MDIEKEAKEFKDIVKKYNLQDENKAQEIANYISKSETISSEEFSKKYNIEHEDAKKFLKFLHKGIKFKEEHLDKKNN